MPTVDEVDGKVVALSMRVATLEGSSAAHEFELQKLKDRFHLGIAVFLIAGAGAGFAYNAFTETRDKVVVLKADAAKVEGAMALWSKELPKTADAAILRAVEKVTV
ncbi:hypothetical protein [Massilia genomosp. 1]|uniref:Uncharacterized protein n=1 Tax=Massilia genomosp. 1 TaxID=2609280 RepID=A0ABX0MTR3_9BURK|nr:hypothetical protein [Massilia genomosp. 1]NHZ66128.1 hypothetical protein [Massilia genomosp. 1]